MAFNSDDNVWREFLQAWPIDRLRTMTLAEYTTAGDRTCFVNWMESRLDGFGSIWGGSAFKFGIYSRNSITQEEDGRGRSYDVHYGWYTKFGDTAAAAFESVRNHVVEVAQAARDGRLEEIDQSPLGDAYKWKIAFHYQSLHSPLIICVYLRKPLLAFLGQSTTDRRIPQSLLYRDIATHRASEESIVALSERAWKQWVFSNPYEIKLSEGAIRNGYLNLNLISAPFPESMHGGSTDADPGESAHFRTDTGFEFDSDIRVSSAGSGRLRRRLTGYLSEVGAKPGESIFITPEGEGSFLISRTPSSSATFVTPASPMHVREKKPVMTQAPLNQILFGPPGTGKTYHAITKALEVLDPELVATTRDAGPEGRRIEKRRFDELAKEGRVQFVTFHQSFSYEDFVEGLRADTDEETGALRYEIADGVFKRLCDAARTRLVKEAELPMDISSRRMWKLSLGDYATEGHIYEECIKNGVALMGFGASADFSNGKTREDIQQTFAAAGEPLALTAYPITAINTFVNQMKKGDLVVVTEGNLRFRAIGEITGDYRTTTRENGDSYVQCRDVRWLRVYKPALAYDALMENRFSQMTIYELREGSIDLDKLGGLLRPRTEVGDNALPRVLIIDEINRGNVSRIFGELITLIEPSKRAGAEEALEAMLPYSKERFSVPNNVYLIGTMNTADRSLAGLDIALRRRFEFVEMPAQPELLADVDVEGIDIEAMITVMNQRIEVLLDRDHHLGHAYFMPLIADPSLKRLSAIFRNQILPLLQEYFFEDWERIRWVLNDQHKQGAGHCFVVPPQHSVSGLFSGTSEVPVDARLWELDPTALGRRESYLGIIDAGTLGSNGG